MCQKEIQKNTQVNSSKKAAETMDKEKLSYKEAARQFGVSFDTVVTGWG